MKPIHTHIRNARHVQIVTVPAAAGAARLNVENATRLPQAGFRPGARFRKPGHPSLTRVPTPVEHARLKGQPEALIRSLPEKTLAHTALGNGCCRRVGEDVFRWIGKAILAAAETPASAAKPQESGELALFAE